MTPTFDPDNPDPVAVKGPPPQKAGEVLDRAVRNILERKKAPVQPAQAVEIGDHGWPVRRIPQTRAEASRVFAPYCGCCDDSRVLTYPSFELGSWSTRVARCECQRGRIDESKQKWKIPFYEDLPWGKRWHNQRWLSGELRRLKGELNARDQQWFDQWTEKLKVG